MKKYYNQLSCVLVMVLAAAMLVASLSGCGAGKAGDSIPSGTA